MKDPVAKAPKLPFAALFALLLVAVWSLASAAQFPVAVTDERGREAELGQQPSRIVSMLPSHTETLCAIGACDLLVGVDDFSNHPPEVGDLPRLGGGLYGFDIEAIVALEPDLVVTSEFGELPEALNDLGITTYAGSPQSFEHMFAVFDDLGALVGRADEARRMSEEVRSEIDALVELTADVEHPTVYFEIDPTPFSAGPDSFVGQAMALGGGANIVTPDMGEFPQVDPEFVIAADPQVIVLGEYTDPDLEARPGWAQISAVQEGRVAQLTHDQGDIVSRPGPRFAQAVELFATLFHPELFD